MKNLDEFINSLEDGWLLHYEGKEYSIEKLEVVGVDLQRDIYVYRLQEAGLI
jgi:hypothetical protein